MEKPQHIGAQVYGYAVCLVSVITFLICVSTLVTSVIDMSDLLHAGWTPAGAPSLASYENYRMDVLTSVSKQDNSLIPDDQSLRAMYEAARNERIQSARHQANKSIVISSLLILICLGLFVTHWRWMHRLSKA